MSKLKTHFLTIIAVCAALANASGAGVNAQPVAASTPGEPFRIGAQVLPLLDNYCVSCHDADEHKGDVRLDNLESLSLNARLDLLNRMHEQFFSARCHRRKRSSPQRLNATS